MILNSLRLTCNQHRTNPYTTWNYHNQRSKLHLLISRICVVCHTILDIHRTLNLSSDQYGKAINNLF